MRAAAIGACFEPGPDWLTAKTPAKPLMQRRMTSKIGSTVPAAGFVSCSRPSEKPFLMKIVPVAMPATNPMRPTQALRSPADILMIMRSGQPKKMSAPIIMMKPSTKRIIGDEPAVDLNSRVASAIKKEPATTPTTSGRRYCTVSVVCSFKAPAVSRMKQAAQNAMFCGFPKNARSANPIPQIRPPIKRPLLALKNCPNFSI